MEPNRRDLNLMDTITISDLEVFYCVGVPDKERSAPQRLLITLQIFCSFDNASKSDSISDAVDYQRVVDILKNFGAGKSWRLIETIANEIARVILSEFDSIYAISVEVKKFIIPETKYISVKLTRTRRDFYKC